MDLHSDPEQAPTQPSGDSKVGRGPSIDLTAVRAHAEILHRFAAPLVGKGKLIVAGFGEDPDRPDARTGKPGWPLPPIVTHVAVGDVQTMVRAIRNIADRPHYNAYSPLSVFRTNLPNGKKGSEGDILAVLGLVADFDDADAPRWAERLPLPPNYVLETSAGRFQAFHLFERPQQPGDAKPVAESLKVFAGCDHGTADLSHVWRIPGCLNWPNSRKIAGGRSREPHLVKVISPWDDSAVSPADLAAALPPAKPNGHGAAHGGSRGREAGANGYGFADFDEATAHADLADGAADDANAALIEVIVKRLPRRLRDRITQPASGDRSRNLFCVIKSLIAHEFDDGTIKRIVQHYPDSIGAKYVGRPDLDREIARVRAKRSRRQAAEADAAASRAECRPVIKIWGGALPAVVDQAEVALIERDPDIYEFGDVLVRPAVEPIRIAKDRKTVGLRLVSIGLNHLIERFTGTADFQRFDKRSDEFLSVDCPKSVAAAYLERIGVRRLRKLTAITTCPVLRPDRTVIDKPGFDESTGILYDPQGAEYPAIPAAPTRAEALAALADLKLLIFEFPFVDVGAQNRQAGHDISRMLALERLNRVFGREFTVFRAFHPCVKAADNGPAWHIAGEPQIVASGEIERRVRHRHVLRLPKATAPMHAFDAPSPGTGKSKLVDCCSLIATGHESPVIAQGKTEEGSQRWRREVSPAAADRIGMGISRWVLWVSCISGIRRMETVGIGKTLPLLMRAPRSNQRNSLIGQAARRHSRERKRTWRLPMRAVVDFHIHREIQVRFAIRPNIWG